MSFSFGFGWAKDDPNHLCMRAEKQASECSYLRQTGAIDMNSFVFPFQLERANFPEPLVSTVYRMSEDYEQISAFMVCRLLTKCADSLLYPDGSAPAIKLLLGDPKSLQMLKSKIGLSLIRSAEMETDSSGDQYEDHYYHTVMFQVYNCLMEKGWSAFATDHQLRGVLAKSVSDTELHVAALTNCTINYKGEGLLHVEMSRYKVSPLSCGMIEEYSTAASQTPTGSTLPSWTPLERSMQCVFLPTAEEVQLTAVIPFLPAGAVHCSPAQYREYEKGVFLAPLDVANKARGFSAYVPDSYARARLYWELAYGILLPKCPEPEDNLMFGRIKTALGQQTVPISALARGAAEISWKCDDVARAAAACVHETVRELPCFASLQSPVHPHELAEQRRQAYSANTGGTKLASRSPFVTALLMRNAQQPQPQPWPPAPPSLRTAATVAILDDDGGDADSVAFSLFGDEAAFSAPLTQLPPPVPLPHAPTPPPHQQRTAAALAAAKPASTGARPRGVPARPDHQDGVVKMSYQGQKAPVLVAAQNLSAGSDSEDLDLSSDSDAPVPPPPIAKKAPLKRKPPASVAAVAPSKASEPKRKKKA